VKAKATITVLGIVSIYIPLMKLLKKTISIKNPNFQKIKS